MKLHNAIGETPQGSLTEGEQWEFGDSNPQRMGENALLECSPRAGSWVRQVARRKAQGEPCVSGLVHEVEAAGG